MSDTTFPLTAAATNPAPGRDRRRPGHRALGPVRRSPAAKSPGAVEWGMIGFLVSEAAFFATLIVAYLTFLGKDAVGPTPSAALSASARALHDRLPPVEQHDDPPRGEAASPGRPVEISPLVGGDDAH